MVVLPHDETKNDLSLIAHAHDLVRFDRPVHHYSGEQHRGKNGNYRQHNQHFNQRESCWSLFRGRGFHCMVKIALTAATTKGEILGRLFRSGLKARDVKAWAGASRTSGGPGCTFQKSSRPERLRLRPGIHRAVVPPLQGGEGLFGISFPGLRCAPARVFTSRAFSPGNWNLEMLTSFAQFFAATFCALHF